jgi:arsenate reductase
MNPSILSYIKDRISHFHSITEDRKNQLLVLVDFISKRKEDESIALTMICTHNSRRSHLTQVWAQVAAQYYGLKNLVVYSGGTEATAMYSAVGQTLSEIGFEVNKLSDSVNPVYALRHDEKALPIICFSKVYDDSFNPKSGFAAVMTCGHADANCPHIPQAAQRISLPYEDPKNFDESPIKMQAYRERCDQVATEMLFVMSQINN